MLTRLEAHGFKNLLNFSIDFAPLTCIAGPNGVGKSNIFDAIQFLSLLSNNSLMDAALKIRGSSPETTDLGDLFWSCGKQHVSEFKLAVEMIVTPDVYDDFGRHAKASSTFLRYEVEIGYSEPLLDEPLGRLSLLSEKLTYITEGDATKHLRFPNSPKFRKKVITNKRKSKAGYISTEEATDGQKEILVHQDGGSSGHPKKSPAKTAPRTIIATANTSTTPTILAARREMQKWNFLSLEPSAMRGADRFHSDPHISSSGEHLPATLYRLATHKDYGDQNITHRIANRLSEMVSIKRLDIIKDDSRQLFTLEAIEGSNTRLPARSLSDGTLRFLTLCILSEDPEAEGLTCMEEPENGIHPAKLKAMTELLRDLSVDTSEEPDKLYGIKQVIIATHSPGMVKLQNSDDLLFAVDTKIRLDNGQTGQTLRCRPLENTWRSEQSGSNAIGKLSIINYLTFPEGSQISFGG